MPGRDELPSTLERSPGKAQETWIKAHDSAVDEYGEGERAHRVAYAALKRSYQKVGDHWEAKARRGPSDRRAADPDAKKRHGSAGTAGGVDANAPKDRLYRQAQRLDIRGRSTMTKPELVKALEKASATRTRRAGSR
ncbi:ChaB family protein [Nocardiopsis potens]|uniref:ChaB family protein n=1 Tax=Nocardiopsis potens TaxID=1246458 RepID=UPI00034B250A|nr:ChaB family protein [Nocardiopsis potens]